MAPDLGVGISLVKFLALFGIQFTSIKKAFTIHETYLKSFLGENSDYLCLSIQYVHLFNIFLFNF